MLQLNDLRQFGEVALHREHAVDHDQFDGILRQCLEDTLQVFHVVVLIVQLLGERQTASVYDRSVVAVVTDDIVVLTTYHSEHTLIHGESR